jgi:aquaporin Z
MPIARRLAAEMFGTFWLVFAGCGSAVLSAAFPQVGIGFLGVALAFGLSVLTMAYAVGHVSGGHLNPAVSVGLATARRFPWRDVPVYALAQVAGAILAAGLLLVIARGGVAFDPNTTLASNGYGRHSPGGYGLGPALIVEVVLTFVFLIVILGSTDQRAPKGFAPIAIGLALTLIHLVAIPVTNTSVNPARSTGPALIAGGPALSQLWLFWLAPLAGGLLAGLVYPLISGAGRPAEVSKPEPRPPVAPGVPREAT